MKKIMAAILTLALLCCALTFAVADEATGVYTLFNGTGENVTEIYLYEAGAEDKGANLAPIRHNSMEVTYTAAPDAVLVLEFVTESGFVGKFETLHIETAPITLLSTDTMTGATNVSFTVPVGVGEYTIYNGTGANVTELYLYPVDAEDKGANLAEGLEDGAVLTYEAPVNTVLVLEFVTDNGFNGCFNTLSIETAPITLLSADTMTGATNISFTVPAAN